MRLGVLTAGGDCPGLNAAIRAIAKPALRRPGDEVWGIEDGYLGLLEGRARPLRYTDVSGVLTHGGTMLGTDNTTDPFRLAARGGADVSDEALASIGRLGLDALVVIGGDGSMSVANRLARRGVPIVGVPKTIDNDLVGTERTIGFDTAVAIAAEALDRLHTTTQSHHRVFVLETMGRHAGWIALHAGLASGADAILLPEIDYDPEEVARLCLARQASGPRFTLIAMAEGARPIGGRLAVRETVQGSADPIRLGGISFELAEHLKPRVGCEVRALVLGHVQRGGIPTPADRLLATAFGARAVELVARGRFGVVVALQGNRLTEIPLATCADQVRRVTPDSPLLAAARAIGISLGVPEASVTFPGGGPL